MMYNRSSTDIAKNADILERLEQSRKETENMERYTVRCPMCGFPLAGGYGTKTGYLDAKCQKCKFTGPMNLSYFRRQNKGQYHIRSVDRHKQER